MSFFNRFFLLFFAFSFVLQSARAFSDEYSIDILLIFSFPFSFIFHLLASVLMGAGKYMKEAGFW